MKKISCLLLLVLLTGLFSGCIPFLSGSFKEGVYSYDGIYAEITNVTGKDFNFSIYKEGADRADYMEGTAKIASGKAEFIINDGFNRADGIFKAKKGKIELSLENSTYDINDGEYTFSFLGNPSDDSKDDEFNVTVTAMRPNPDYLLIKETTQENGETRIIQYTYNSGGQRETEKTSGGETGGELIHISDGTYSNYDQFNNPGRCIRTYASGEKHIIEYKYTVNGMIENTVEYAADGSVWSEETIEYDSHGNKIKLSRPYDNTYIEYKHKSVEIYHSFHKDGTEQKHIRKYDKNNNLIKETRYLDNEIVSSTVYEYKHYTAVKKPTVKSPSANKTKEPTATMYHVRKSSDNIKSQIGAFANYDNAVKFANQRASEGYKVFDDNGTLVYAPLGGSSSTPAGGASSMYRVRKSANDSQSQIGAFSDYNNAVKHADKNRYAGYKVYDEYGNLVYAPSVGTSSSSAPAGGASSMYRVRKSAGDSQSQIGAFSNYNNAVNLAKQRAGEGYKVYDEYGNLVFAP